MKNHIGCDAHKHFSMFVVLDDKGHIHERARINHAHGAIMNYLSQFPQGTPDAIESVGNWYLIISKEQLCRNRRCILPAQDGACGKGEEPA